MLMGFIRVGFSRIMIFTGILFILIWGSFSQTNAASKKIPPVTGLENNLVTLYPDLAEDLGFSREQHGVAILGIFQNSPAEKADIHEGDLIIKVQDKSGKVLEIPDLAVYQKKVGAIPADKPLVLILLRQGKEINVQLMRISENLGLLIQPPPRSEPRIIKVAADGSGDCKTIDGAMCQSRPGDSILLMDGKYAKVIVRRNNVSIGSFDPQKQTVIPGVAIGNFTGTKVHDLTIVSSDNKLPENIYGVTIVSGNQTSISNCQIHGFPTGVIIDSSSDVVLEGNTISENNRGIDFLNNNSNTKIVRNLIRKNPGGGIRVNGQAVISNNNIIENRVSIEEFGSRIYKSGGREVPGVGIEIIAGSTAQIYNNIIAFNTIGCLIDPTSHTNLEYNDLYQQVIEAKELALGFFGGVPITIRGANSNVLSKIQIDSKEPPLLSLDTTTTYTYTPVLLFQPSSTNISADPLFNDSFNSDYRIVNDSPLIGKGRSNSFIGAFPPVDPKLATVSASDDTKPTTDTSSTQKTTTNNTNPKIPAVTIVDKTLFVDAKAIDQLVEKLKERISGNPQLKEQFVKSRVGIVNFSLLDLPGINLNSSFNEALSVSLINNGFQLCNQNQLNKILRDLKVENSSQIDQTIAPGIKKTSDCEWLLLGTIANQPQSVVLNIKIMDSASGNYLVAERLEVGKN
jgi:parallel beta-helix repeat protein